MPEHTPAPTHARSLYGFFMYLFSKTVLGIYVVWAFTPDYYLHYFNIYYYPQKYWSTALPVQCLVALTLFAFIVYPSLNLTLTPKVDNVRTIRDSHSHYINDKTFNVDQSSNKCICRHPNKCKKSSFNVPSTLDENKVPQLYDLNIKDVCKKLYLDK